jgi:hypothetical protein
MTPMQRSHLFVVSLWSSISPPALNACVPPTSNVVEKSSRTLQTRWMRSRGYGEGASAETENPRSVMRGLPAVTSGASQ